MSARNRLANKKARREERVARKESFLAALSDQRSAYEKLIGNVKKAQLAKQVADG